ncbi:MAG: protein-L-isoaspartate(D-aspartate) O-methyltransferase [Planctomycetes bacterium]|nr:protein-L-isoaspartate(D-aspartate) O-methyltransferase [Planctomycetota bacterium]
MKTKMPALALLFVLPFVLNAAARVPAGPEEKAAEAARFAKLRERMVEDQIRARGIKDEATLAAMRKIERHKLVPDNYIADAYEDRPLPIGHGQTISQPYIVALMTSLLGLGPGHRVLEVGTGSGYQAAVLAEIVAKVYTIEIYRALHERARDRLTEMGLANVAFRHADGALGWQEEAPFDAIIVTCAASHIPPALLKQLKPGGKMCIPVGPPFGDQRLVLVEKDADGAVTTRTILGVVFVALIKPADAGDQAPAPEEEKKPAEDKKREDR